MTEADVIQPSASIASTGKGFRYIGDWAYIFSGVVTVDEVETTLVDTTTGAGIIVGQFQVDYANAVVYTEDLLFQVYINEQIIYRTTLSAATSNTPTEEIEIILPPLTKFKITCTNITNSSNRQGAVIFTGRVYGAT